MFARRSRSTMTAGCLGVLLCAGAPAQQPSPRPGSAPAAPAHPAAAASTLEQNVRDELERINADLAAGKPLPGLYQQTSRLFDLFIAYADLESGAGTLRDLAVARRFLGHLTTGKAAPGKPLIEHLLANPDLLATLALSVRPEDDIPKVYQVLESLRAQYASDISDRTAAAPLATAICVVYDKPPVHPVLGTPTSTEPGAIFSYFRSGHGKMLFRPDTLPVELLTYIVDAHAPVTELDWAMKAYAGNRTVGKLYGSIVYDTAAFKYGKSKKVIDAGYTLPNIRKLGGVCAEQAYFASEVGKAIGDPSCYVAVAGAEVGHAYVGYLRQNGQTYSWDFSEGRYDEYKDLQGQTTDPQTGRVVPDSFVSLTAGLASTPRANIQRAVALTDAAQRLGQAATAKQSFPPKWPQEWGAAPAAPLRGTDAASQLALLQAALQQCPAYEPAWRTVVQMAEKNMLSSKQKSEWADAAMKMCARNQPDFALWCVQPMISTVTPPPEQDRMWEWAFGQFQQRPDLASQVRLAQGQAWEKAGDTTRAMKAYQDIITRYANDGRAVIEALSRGEDLLAKANHPEQIVGLYEDAFRRIKKPRQMSAGFSSLSNYSIVGLRYAEVLEHVGRGSDAKRIRKQIGAEEPNKNQNGKP